MLIPNQFKSNKPYQINISDLPEKYQKLFIADAGISNFGMPRTQWLDKEERDRVITPRGKAQNLLCIDSGSTDLFFEFGLITKLRDKTKLPDYRGDIKYTIGSDGYIERSWFEIGGKNSTLYWWGELPHGRPHQGHNFVVGSDLSKGTGTSNSVSAVLDVNNNEICGLLVTPYYNITDFAELTVALCEWVGGNEQPLLIWEENGAAEFLERINALGYYNQYVKMDKEGNELKTKIKHGWRSTGGKDGTKINLLNALDAALHEGLREKSRFTPLKLYDEQVINEIESYVIFEGKIDVGPVALQTESSGAKLAHGDRVIAVALCHEGRKQMQPGTGTAPQFANPGSFMSRFIRYNDREERRKANEKQWMYKGYVWAESINKSFEENMMRQGYPERLQLMAKSWTKKWEGPLEHSQKCVNLWASGYYQKGYSRWHLVNLMNRGVSSVVSYLVEGNPKVLIEPLSPSLRPFAYAMRLIINFLIEKYNFADNVLIPGATASMFGNCYSRVFYEYDRRVAVENDNGKIDKIKVGTPKVAIIEPCDYIGDPSAKRYCDFAIEGDRYRLPTKYAKDLFSRKDKFGNQIADHIKPDAKLVTKYSAEEIASQETYDFNKLAEEDYTTFIDIFNYKTKTIDTIMPMGKKAVILKTIEWKGPGSPYDSLGYKYPPNIPVCIPPAWDWYDLDVTMNIMAKAAREQAESQKNVIGAEPAGKKAGQAVLKAKNMDVVTVKNMASVKQFTFGGVNPENYGWMQWAEQQFGKAGTTSSDMMSGKKPQAKTLGQEQLLYQNASRIVNNFYNRFHEWETSILRKWMWAVIENPSTYVEILDTIKLPGIGEYEYPVYFSKADKVADFYQLALKVVPYSSQRTSPEMKYQRLFQFMSSWILPTMQMREAQGSTIDLAQADKILADYGGFDSFPQWYKSVVPQDSPQIDYLMKTGSGKNQFGQQNDSMGASEPSRAANSAQQQNRTTGSPEGGLRKEV